MKKIKNVICDIESLLLRVECINSLAFILWDSMVNGGFSVTEETHGMSAYLLSMQTQEIKNDLEKALNLLCEGAKELKA